MKSNNNIDDIINELVDNDGYLISGDKPEYNSGAETEVPDTQTNDEFLQASIAPKRLYWYSSLGIPTASTYQCDLKCNNKTLTKEAFMKSILPEEKFVNFKNRDILNKNNETPSIDSLNGTKPTLVITTKNFIETINKTPITTSEKDIIINYINSNIEVNDMK